jgi:hypothetical protein
VYNKWNRAFDFWFNRVKEGYIVELTINYIYSFGEVEKKFVEGPLKRLLEEIPLWIKMLFVKNGLMCMESDKMVEYIPSC